MAEDRLGGKKTLKVGGFLDEFEKDDIKAKVDIVRLFESYGVELTKKGRNYTGLCPFHDDKEPSLSVMRDKGLCNCFSSCCSFEGGDIFNVVQAFEKCDFKQALKILKKWSGNGHAPVSKKTEPVKAPAPKEEAGKAEPKKQKPELSLKDVAGYYHKKLYENKQAISYLEKRGFTAPELWGRFMFGFCDGTLLNKLSESQKQQFIDSGILKVNQKTGQIYEHLKNCITIPQFDANGLITGIYGRRIADD